MLYQTEVNMNNCKPLGDATNILIPNEFPQINWSNIWGRKLENGTAFEWATTAAIICAARQLGFEVTLPLLSEYQAYDYYILRNEIPLTYGAQVGNSDTMLRSKPLNDRFLYCFVPKAILHKNDSFYSVFREGCPYHKIMSGKSYLERTDIIIVPGKPSEGFPILSSSGKEVLFKYEYNNQIIDGVLIAKSSPYIPVKKRSPKGGIDILASIIIECSVNKTFEVASEQLSRYKSLFNVGEELPFFSLVTGNDLSSMPFDTHTINLTTDNPSSIADALLDAATTIIEHSIV